MNYRSHLDGVRFGSWSFREVLDRLLSIASSPVRQALKGEPVGHASELVEKACQVINYVINSENQMDLKGKIICENVYFIRILLNVKC